MKNINLPKQIELYVRIIVVLRNLIFKLIFWKNNYELLFEQKSPFWILNRTRNKEENVFFDLRKHDLCYIYLVKLVINQLTIREVVNKN